MPISKLKRLGFGNQIINNSDSKPSELECWFWSNSNLIQKLYHQSWFQSYFDLFSIKFDQIWLKDQKRSLYCRLKEWKCQLKDQKSQLKDQ